MEEEFNIPQDFFKQNTGEEPPTRQPKGKDLASQFDLSPYKVPKQFFYDPDRDRGLSHRLEQYKARSMTQPWTEQFGRGTGRALLNVVPTVVGNTAAILDFEDYFNQDAEVGNAITRAMEDLKKENSELVGEIYRENPGKPLDLGDSGWWFDNGSQVLESAGAFAITGFGLGSALSKGAQGLKWLSTLGKSSQLGQGATTGVSVLNAVGLNQAEAITSAINVYDNILIEASKQGLNSEEAKQKAADAAAYSINVNRANILLNLSSASAFVKGAGSTRNLIKEFGTLKRMGFEGAQEYAEEVINLYAEQSGTRAGKQLLDTGQISENFDIGDLVSLSQTPEGIEAGLLGALGGIVQTGATELGNKLLGRKRQEKAQRIAQQEYIKDLDNKFESNNIPSTSRVIRMLIDSKDLIDRRQDLLSKEQVTSKDRELVQDIDNLLLARQAGYAFELGTTESLLDLYDKIENLTEEEAAKKGYVGEQLKERSYKYYKTKAREAANIIEDLEKVFQKTEGYINRQNIYDNRTKKYLYSKKIGSYEDRESQAREDLRQRIDQLPDFGASEIKLGYSTEDLIFTSQISTKQQKTAKTKLNKRIKETTEYKELVKLREYIKKFKSQVTNLNDQYDELTSSSTQEKIKAQQQKIQEDKDIVDSVISDIDDESNISDLEEAKSKVKTEESKKEIDKAIEERKSRNKKELETILTDATYEAPEVAEEETVVEDGIIDPTTIEENVLPFEDDPDDTILPTEEQVKAANPRTLGELEELKNSVQEELTPIEEEPSEQDLRTPPVDKGETMVKTVLKEFNNEIITNDKGEEELRLKRNPDGTYEETLYENRDTGDKVPATEVFETDGDILLVNSPNLEVGTKVRIVAEPNWKYYKSEDTGLMAMLVYREGSDKPLSILPAATSTVKKGKVALGNQYTDSLRELVLEKDIVNTVITDKNNGDLLGLRFRDGTRAMNSVSVLEEDWVNIDGRWVVSKTDHNPIFGIAKPGVGGTTAVIPNYETMEGVANNPSLLEEIEQASKLIQAAQGTIITLRRTPSGTFDAAQVDPLQLSDQQVKWLKNNLATLLQEEQFDKIKKVLYIPNLVHINNLESASGNRILLDENDIIFKMNKDNWVKVTAKGPAGFNLENMLSGKPFKFRIIDGKTLKYKKKNGEMYFDSSKSNKEQVDKIRARFDQILQGSFKNIESNRLNSEDEFTDPVSGKTFDNYYGYIIDQDVISTDLPGGASYKNATIYLNASDKSNREVNPVDHTVEQTIEQDSDITDLGFDPNADIDSFIDENIDLTRYKEAPSKKIPGLETITQAELDWFRTKFGEDALVIAKETDKIITKGGLEAYGMYNQALITIADRAASGTTYHEAFHYVFNLQLSGSEKSKIRQNVEQRGSKFKKVNYGDFIIDENKSILYTSDIFSKPIKKKNLFPKEKNSRAYIQTVDVSQIVPTQETISSKYISSGEDFLPTAYFVDGEFVLNDGHHRVSKAIVNGDTSIELEVRYGIGTEEHKLAIEEELADEFQQFMMSKDYKPRVNSIIAFFKKLLTYIQRALGKASAIETLFNDIAYRPFTMKEKKEFDIIRSTSFKTDDTVRYKVIPGLNSRMQQDMLNTAATEILNMTNADTDSRSSIGEILSNDKNLTNYISVVRSRLNSGLDDAKFELSNLKSDPESTQQELNKQLFKAYAFRETLKNWEDFTDLLYKHLAKYGFTLSAVPYNLGNPGTEQLMDDYVVDEGERVFDISFTLRDPKSTLSREVIRELSTLPELVRDDNGNYNTVETLLETPKILNFNKVYATLTTNLAGVDNIYDKLTELSEKNPLLASVKQRLDQRKSNGATSFDTFYSKFMSNFNKASYDFITVKYRRRQGKPTVDVIDTNRKTIFSDVTNAWKNNAISKGVLQSDGTVNPSKVFGIKEDLQILKNSSPGYTELADKFITLTDKVGIEIPVSSLKSTDANRVKDLRKIIFGKSAATFEQFVDKLSEGDDAFEKEQSALRSMVELVKPVMVNLVNTGSFIDEKGNQHNSINLPSYISKTVNKLKNRDYVMDLAKDKFYSPSIKRENKFLNYLRNKENREDFKVKMFSSLVEGNRATSFQTSDNQQSLLTRIGAFYNGGSSIAYYSLGTLSDKKQHLFAQLPKLKESKEEIKKVLRNTVSQEVARIRRVKNNSFAKTIKNYKNADKFLYIPEINSVKGLADSLVKGEKSPDTVLRNKEEVNIIIDKFVDNQLNQFLDKLQEYEMIQISGKTIIPLGLPPFLSSKELLADFFYNDMLWRMEMSKVFAGDIAFYKNSTDYVKRSYQLITPGIEPHVEPGYNSASQKTTVKKAVFSEVQKINDDEYIVGLARLIDPGVSVNQVKEAYAKRRNNKDISNYPRAVKIAVAYAVNNKTDAQSYSSIEFWRDQAIGLGQWTNDHETIYENAWSKGVSVDNWTKQLSNKDRRYYLKREEEFLLQPLKPFYFGERRVELEDGSIMFLKEQFKDSITPVLPEWGNKHEGFREVLKALKKVDIVSAEDSVKVGLHKVTDWDKIGDITSENILETGTLRYPLQIPPTKKTNRAGTQIEKLIIGNVVDTNEYTLPNGESITGKEIKTRYHNIWSQLIKNSSDTLEKRLRSSDRVQFLRNLSVILKEGLANREESDNYYDALKIVQTDLGRPDFILNLSFPAFGRRYENLLINLYKKEVIEQEFPGYSYVNLADFSTGIDEELSFIKNENDEVVEAEVSLPYNQELGISENSIDENGKIIWESLDENQKQGLQSIVYRIPTQGKNSMLPVRIVKILPKSAGSVIMLPGEGTTQGGFDFDVDKSFLMFRSFDKEDKIIKDEETREGKYNQLFDIHWSILTSANHAEELLNPLDNPLHDNLISQLGVEESNENLSVFNPIADLNYEQLAKYSKAMVGIFSLGSVAYSTMQSVPDQVSIEVPLQIIDTNNRQFTFDKISLERDNKGNLVSENHSIMQNSALDAQKKPRLGYLNVTTFNAPVATYMTSLGLDQTSVIYYMNQPVLKSLSASYFAGNNSLNKAKMGLFSQQPNIEAAYKTLKSADSRSVNVTTGNLKTNVKTTTDEYQAQILLDFENYYRAANDMFKASKALSTDTFRDMYDVASLQAFESNVNYSTGNRTTVKVNPELFGSKSPIGRLSAFYRYGVKRALRLTSEFYPYNTDQYLDIGTQVAIDLNLDDGILDTKDKRNIVHIGINNLIISDSINQLIEKISPDYTTRWSYTSTSNSIVKRFNRIVEQFPRLKSNEFIKALSADPHNDRNTIKMLIFNNTNNNNDKSILTNSWEDLLNDKSPEVVQLANDLVRFAVQTSGFTTTPNSFVDLIPVSFWKSSNLADYHRERVIAFLNDTADKVNPNEASKIIVRHFFEELGVPKIYARVSQGNIIGKDIAGGKINSKGDIEEITMIKSSSISNNKSIARYATYARLYNRRTKKFDLFERIPESLVYQRLQPLGEPNRLYEFVTTSDAVSKHPDNRKITLPKNNMFSKVADIPDLEGVDQSKFQDLGLDLQGEGTIKSFLETKRTDTFLNRIQDVLTSNEVDITNYKIRVVDDTLSDGVASFDTNTGMIRVSTNYFKKAEKKDVESIIMHEVLHAFSIRVLFDPKTKVQREFKNNVYRFYYDNKSKIEKLRSKKVDQLIDEDNESFYGLTDQYEFLSELFSNQQFYNTIKETNSGNWFRRLIRYLRKLLGFPTTESRQYDTLMGNLMDVINEGEALELNKNQKRRIDQELFSVKRNLNKLEDMAKKAVGNLEKKLEKFKKRRQVSDTYKQRLKNIISSLESLESTEKLIGFVYSSVKDIDRVRKRYDKLSSEDALNVSNMSQMKDYLGSYDILRSIRDWVRRNPEDFKQFETGEGGFSNTITKAISILDGLTADIDEFAIKSTAKWIKTKTSENLELTEIENQLRMADRDVTWVNRLFDAPIDSRDIVLRSIAKEILEAKEAARLKTEEFLRKEGGYYDINQEYESWLREQGVDINNTKERNKFILDEETSEGLYFIDPQSEKGKQILSKPVDHPLRKYYEAVLKNYLESQKTIPVHMRPGLRVPSVRQSTFEIFTDAKGLGKLNVITEGIIDTFKRNYDETDRQATDEQGNPLDFIPVRFISPQNGGETGMKVSEVSRDVASTVLMFIDEMNNHDEMYKVVDQIELAKDVLAKREVAKTKRKNLISSEVIAIKDEQGYTITSPGIDSDTYKQAETLIKRMVYGEVKKDEGSVEILGFKFDVAKTVDAILKYTGLKLLAFNLDIAFSNAATGNVTLLKEATGGKWFSTKDWRYGKKKLYSEIPAYSKEYGKRKVTSKLGVIMSLYNLRDSHRGNLRLGKDTNRLRALMNWKSTSILNDIGEVEMRGTAMLAMMNRVKLTTASGEEINLYDAYEVANGKASLKKGLKYKGREFTVEDFNKIRNSIISVNQKLHGIYNTLDSSSIKYYAAGRLILSMRSWLKPGIDARFRTQYYNERLQQDDEGHYISAIRFFSQMFGPGGEMKNKVKDLRYLFGIGLDNAQLLSKEEEANLSEDKKADLINLRKANIKKSLVEIYTIAALSVMLMTLWGDGGEEDDSFIRYQIARLRRELLSFSSPTTAWEVLKSPTVALRTVEDAIDFVYGSTVGLGSIGEAYESGPYKGMNKYLVRTRKNIPLWSQFNQFDRYDIKTEYIERGLGN